MSLQKVLEAWQGKPLDKLLVELYIDEDLTVEQISKRLNISVGVIHNYLRKFNIDKQPKLWTNKLERKKKKNE